MPNNSFGNPFAVPHTQVTSLKTSMPDPSQSLAALMKMQMAQQRMALAAARAAGGGGGRKGPQEGDPRYGRYAMVPQKDGTKKPVWVWGTSGKERDNAEAKAISEATQAILSGDEALQKDLANFESLSIPGRKEVLDRVRQTHAPRLARTLGVSGEELSKQLTAGLDESIRAREKDIDKAGLGTQLLHAGKQIFRNITDAIGAIGETPQQQLARGKANAEAAAQDAKENAFIDEIQRLEAEGRSSTGFQLENWGKSAVMHATPLAAMIAPAIAGGAIGTMVAPGPGTLGGLVSGATIGAGLGGAVGAGLPAAGEAMARVATDPNLTEAQKEDVIGQTAAISGLTAGAIGAIPVGPASLVRGALAKRAVAKAFPEGVSATVARQLTPAATAAERAAAEKAFLQAQTKSWTPNLWQQMGIHGTNAAAIGGAFQVGSNAAYGIGTGQDIPLTQGLGEALMSGAILGLPFGIGGRARSMFKGQPVGVNPAAQPDWASMGGTWAADLKARTEPTPMPTSYDMQPVRDITRVPKAPSENLPTLYNPIEGNRGERVWTAPEPQILHIRRTGENLYPEPPAPLALPEAVPMLERGTGAWPMGEEPRQAREDRARTQLRAKIEREMKVVHERQAKERAALEKLEGEQKALAQAELKQRQAEELEAARIDWNNKWDGVYNPTPQRAKSGDNSVISSRPPEQRGITPLFETPPANPDPMGVLARRRTVPEGEVADMTMLEHENFVRSKPKFEAFQDRVDTANESRPQDITDLLKRGIERGSISRAEVEVIAQNVADNALKYEAVQRALTEAKEPPKKMTALDKFFSNDPDYNTIYTYLDRDGVTSKEAAAVIERAILEDKLTVEQAEIMAQNMAADAKGGKNNVVVKGIIQGIKNAEAVQAERAMQEVESEREPAYQVSSGREQATNLGTNEQVGTKRPDGTDNAANRKLPADTETVAPAAPDTNARPVVESREAVEERGPDGETSPNTRPPAENPPVVDEQGTGGEKGPIGESSSESAATLNAEGGEGKREPEPASEQRTGDAGNAEQVDERTLEPPTKPNGVGGRGTVVESGELYSDPARYEVWEQEDVIPSHDATKNFMPNKDKYPAIAQERLYDRDKGEQEKILAAVIRFNPEQIISDTTGATQGPPIVTKDGYVLGGNSRTMMVNVLYDKGKAQPYKDTLIAKARSFGLDPEAIRKMKQPMLVRVLDGTFDDNAMAVKSRDYNTSDAFQLDSRVELVSRGRSFTPELIEELANLVEGFRKSSGKSQTLHQYLRNNGTVELAAKFVDAGIIKPTERSKYLTTKGALNKEGQELINRAILGHFFDDPKLLIDMPDKLRNKLQGSLLQLVEMQNAQDKGNLLPDLLEAARLVTTSHANGKNNLSQLIGSTSLMGESVPRKIAALALLLERGSVGELRARFAAYNKLSNELSKQNSMQVGLLGASKQTYKDAFDKAFGKPLGIVGKQIFEDFQPGRNITTEAIAYANQRGWKNVATAVRNIEKELLEKTKDPNAIKDSAKLRQMMTELTKHDGKIDIFEPHILGLSDNAQRLNDITKNIGSVESYAKQSIPTKVVGSFDRLPEEIQRAHPEKTDAESIYDPTTNQLFILTDNIKDPVRATEVWAQQQLMNGGMRSLLPEKEYSGIMTRLWSSIKSNKAAAKTAKDFGIEFKGKPSPSEKAAQMETLLGEVARNRADNSIKPDDPLYNLAVTAAQNTMKRAYEHAGYRGRGTRAQGEALLEQFASRQKDLKEAEANSPIDEPASSEYMDMASQEIINGVEQEATPIITANKEKANTMEVGAKEKGFDPTKQQIDDTNIKDAQDILQQNGKVCN